MQSSVALNVGLPIALFIIMLGLGLSLKLEDFTRTLTHPKPMIVGIICHSLILPLLCLGLVYISDLPPAIAVGVMLLAVSPGGTSASLYSHLARGDAALSIAFAGVTTLLATITLPIVAQFSMLHFYGEGEAVSVEMTQVLQIFAIAIVPATIGAFIRSRRPHISQRLERPVKILATLFLAAVVLFALISQWHLVLAWGPVVGLAVLVFNIASLLVGYYVPLSLGVARRQAVALSMSIGIHNAALVIALALSVYMLNNSEIAIAPAMYGLLAYFTSAFFVWILNRSEAGTGAQAG